MYGARDRRPRSWQTILAGALFCSLLVLVFGCTESDDPLTTAPETPFATLDEGDDGEEYEYEYEFDLVLDAGDEATWPAGASSATEALQMAVDAGGAILLAGTFDFGADEQILIGQEGNAVILVGEGTAGDGYPATKILGGHGTFEMAAPVEVTIENLHFDAYTAAAVWIFHNQMTLIRRNAFTNGQVGLRPGDSVPEVFTIFARDQYSLLQGTIKVTGNRFEDTEYPTVSWPPYWTPGFYGGGVGIGSVGSRGDPQRLTLYVDRNIFDQPGYLGGVVVNGSWAMRAFIRDNEIHQVPNWSYSAIYTTYTPAPVIARNEITYAWWFGIRTANIDGAVIDGNTVHAYDTVWPDDCWSISVAIDVQFGTNNNVTIRNNVLQGAMARGATISSGVNCSMTNNDFRDAMPGSPASILLALPSYYHPTYGGFDATGCTIANNHFPEVQQGAGWTFGLYKGGYPPYSANPVDNLIVGGDTDPTAVFFDETDLNPDPDVYEGLNTIIFPSFWKGTTPEHIGDGENGRDWINGEVMQP